MIAALYVLQVLGLVLFGVGLLMVVHIAGRDSR